MAHVLRHQSIDAGVVSTRAEASRELLVRCGVLGGAGAGELCKSVEVHSSDPGAYGAIAPDRQTRTLSTEVFARVCVETACWEFL